MEPRPRAVVSVHPLANYSFGHAPARAEKSAAQAARLARLEARYATEGARRTVEGVILVNEHNHPHVLLLQARTRARGRRGRRPLRARVAATAPRRLRAPTSLSRAASWRRARTRWRG